MSKLKNHPLLLFPDFRKLFLARTISAIGDSFFLISLAWYILHQLSATQLQFSIIMALTILPVVLMGPFMGTLVDLINKKTSLIASDLIRGVLMLTLTLLITFDLSDLWILYIFSFLIASLNPLFESATQASLKELTDDDHLNEAVALDGMTLNIATIFGAALSGFMVTTLGTLFCFYFNAATFFISYGLILLIKNSLHTVKTTYDENPELNSKFKSYLDNFKEGIGYIRYHKTIMLLLLIFVSFNFFGAPLKLYLPLLVTDLFHVPAYWIGFFESAMGLGSVIMSLYLSTKLSLHRAYERLFAGILLVGSMMVAMGFALHPYTVCFYFLLSGVGLALVNALVMALFQQVVPQKLKGRFFALVTTFCFSVIPLTYLLNGLLTNYLTLRTLLIINGSISSLLALPLLLIPRIKPHDSCELKLDYPYDLSLFSTILKTLQQHLTHHTDTSPQDIEDLLTPLKEDLLNALLYATSSTSYEQRLEINIHRDQHNRLDLSLKTYRGIQNYHLKHSATSTHIKTTHSHNHKNAGQQLSYKIRKMKAHESFSICRSLYEVYGCTYIYPAMYQPQRLKSMNKDCQLISYVAVTDDGDLMAHLAMSTKGTSCELLAAFTKEPYRHFSCLTKLVETLLIQARKRGHDGAFVYAVTSHIYSQKSALKHGLRETALLLSASNPLHFKGIVHTQHREHLLLHYLYLTPSKTMNLYLPSEYKDILLAIYNNMKVHVHTKAPENELLLGSAATLSISLTDNKTCYIKVQDYGQDLETLIKNQLKSLSHQRFMNCFLSLPMMNPATPQICTMAMELGFILAGLHPSLQEQELLLQYPFATIDFSIIKTHSTLGAQLLHFVEEEYIERERRSFHEQASY